MRLVLNVASDAEILRRFGAAAHPAAGKYHYLSGLPGADAVLYRRPLLFGSELLLGVERVVAGSPTIWVNPPYYRLVKFRIMNLHSVGFFLADLATLLLWRAGLAPLHCSAFKWNNRAVVVFAPSNTGKTLTTMKMCESPEARFVAEDIAISDGGSAYSVPWTSTFRYYEAVDARLGVRIERLAKKVVPWIEFLPLVRAKPITEFLQQERICDKAQVTDVVVLERGPAAVLQEPRAATLRRIKNLNRMEFNFKRTLIINAFEYFNPQLDVNGAESLEADILCKLVSTAQTCRIVRAESPLDYPRLLREFLA
ncbi:hypothetical protein JXD38_11000 [candidate division WOR-3 bacterium]|nr:hypothetical protein [candidate division WOR-3 bacterium]